MMMDVYLRTTTNSWICIHCLFVDKLLELMCEDFEDQTTRFYKLKTETKTAGKLGAQQEGEID